MDNSCTLPIGRVEYAIQTVSLKRVLQEARFHDIYLLDSKEVFVTEMHAYAYTYKHCFCTAGVFAMHD